MEPMEHSSKIEEMLCLQANAGKKPISGILELLPLCNMNCNMCYVRLSKTEMEREGKLRSGREWLELGKQMQQAGTLFCLLTGGEPLLHPDFKEIYLGLKKLGMVLTINTNGTLIDDEWVSLFGRYKPRCINITLYGADDRAYQTLCHYPGGFQKVISAIKNLKKSGVEVKLNGSITPANCNDAEKIIEIAKQLGVPFKLDTYMYPASRERKVPFDQQSRLSPEAAAAVRVKLMRFGKTPREFHRAMDRLLHEIENPSVLPENGFTCRAGSSSFMVNWQGMMRPCIMVNKPTVAVFDMGFFKAWESIVEQTSKIRLSPKCAGCALRSACPICAAAALLETGSYMETPAYLCRYTEESLRLLRQAAEEMKDE